MREDADVVTSSDDYARRFSGAVGRYFLDVQAAATLALLRPFAGASVLDVGGGHGQLTGALVESGHRVTVLGSDPACEARVAPWTRTGRAHFVADDLIEPRFVERSFDVVLSFRLLPHARRWRDLVSTLSRLALKAVVVDYPTRRSVNVAAEPLFALKKGVEQDTRPFTVFRDRELEQAFAAHGLHPTGRRPQFFFPLALHRAMRSATLARALEGAAGTMQLTRWLGSPVILRLEPAGRRLPDPAALLS